MSGDIERPACISIKFITGIKYRQSTAGTIVFSQNDSRQLNMEVANEEKCYLLPLIFLFLPPKLLVGIFTFRLPDFCNDTGRYIRMDNAGKSCLDRSAVSPCAVDLPDKASSPILHLRGC
jgi:hypothetical protein